jgi:ABC-type phosphate transport system substrate-binding protein
MTKASAAALGILMGLLCVARGAGAETAPEYKLIVNAANPTKSLGRDTLMRMFLKKTTAWPDGKPVLVVDQPTQSATRRAFSRDILGRGPNDVAAYWNEVIFSGRGAPPLTKPSDAEVLSYVHDNPNAIGYVGADADVGAGLRVFVALP